MISVADPSLTRVKDSIILYIQFDHMLKTCLLLKFFFDPFPIINSQLA